MIRDSITLYNNYQYLNLKCYSCGSKSHITLECPKFHLIWDRKKIVAKYREAEIEFRKNFIRMPRKRFNALMIIEELNEAVSQIQVIQQNELYVEDGQEENVQIYSEGEEILDRNIYDPQPITYTVEPIQTKRISIPRNQLTSLQSFQLVQQEKRRRTANELGDVHSFAISNYDAYYHSLNLDKVKNFEVYYPNNNINKLLVGMEKNRLEKIVHMRLGVNAKHISPLLVKSFRMNERRKTREAAAEAGRENSLGSFDSGLASPKQRRETLPAGGRRETITGGSGRRETITGGRRETLSGKIISNVNPVDITFYNSYQKSSVDFSNTNRSHKEDSDHDKKHLSYPNPHHQRRSFGGISSPNSSPNSAGFYYDIPQSLQIHQGRGSRIVEAGSGDDIPQEKFNFPRHPRRRSSKRSNTRSRVPTEDNQFLEGTDEHSDSASDSDSRTHSVLNTRLKVGGSQFRSEIFSRDGSVYTDKTGSPSHFLKNLNNKNQQQQQRHSRQFDQSYDLTIQSRKESSEGLHVSSRPRLSSQIRGSLLGVGPGTGNFFEDNAASGVFDFSKQMQKISQKLEENRPSIVSRSKERRRTRKKTINSNNIMSIMLSEQNEKEQKILRKGRSFSQDMGREIGKVIEQFGIEKVFSKNRKR